MAFVLKRFLTLLGILALLGAAFVVYARLTSRAIDGISCDFGGQIRYHVHAHLTILLHGRTSVLVPSQIGIDSTHLCLYWLHTHDASGIIHVEAPRVIRPTLGQFFAVWHQPLSLHDVAGHVGAVRVYVNGKPVPHAPSRVVLLNHTDVVLEVGRPYVKPPKASFVGF